MEIELRDYFATHCPPSIYNSLQPEIIKALNQLEPGYSNDKLTGLHTIKAMATLQYHYADVMLAVRELKFED